MSEKFAVVETAADAPPVAVGTAQDGAEDDVARLIAVLGQAVELAGLDLQHRQAIVDLLCTAGDIARAGEGDHVSNVIAEDAKSLMVDTKPWDVLGRHR